MIGAWIASVYATMANPPIMVMIAVTAANAMTVGMISQPNRSCNTRAPA